MKNDEIRGMYTAYIARAAGFARKEYLRTLLKYAKEISVEELPESFSSAADIYFEDELNIGEERLSQAVSGLPLLRRQLLCMLFVEQMTALEISEQLGCSINTVYKEKHRLLRKIRDMMEGEMHEQ